MGNYEKIIADSIKTVMDDAVCAFEKWYMDDFETDVYFENEGEFKNLSDEEYGEAQSDWVAFVINGFVANVCENLGIDTEYYDTTINKTHLIETIYEDVKSELFNRTNR